MKDLTLKSLLAAVVALLVAVGAASSVSVWSRFRTISAVDASRDLSLDAMLALKDTRFHVVQIQQFLTGVGATHDQGGSEKARNNEAEALKSLAHIVEVVPALKSRIDGIGARIRALRGVGEEMAAAYVANGIDAGNAIMKRPETGLDDASSALSDDLDALGANIDQKFDGAAQAARDAAEHARRVALGTLAGLVALVTLALFVIYRRVVPPLSSLKSAMEAIRDGGDATLDDLHGDFRQIGGVFNQALERIAQQRETDLARAAANARVVQALDMASTCVLVLDAEGRVGFVNQTLQAVLREQAAVIRADAPTFNPDALTGVRFVTIMPAIAEVQNDRVVEQALGERTFQLIGNPVVSESGEALGSVIEWRELTQQKLAQHQIDGMIYGAKTGHLDWRLELPKFEPGFWRSLATGINQMLDALVKPLDLAAKYVDEIAHGRTPERITGKYEGHFAKVTDNLNRCIGAIGALIEDAGTLAGAGAAGRLDARGDPQRHEGAFRRIIEDFNETLDAIATPLADTQHVITALADGDLTRRVTVDARGDFAELRDAINGSLDKLAATVDEIRQAAGSMRRATSEIASGNDDLSRRTEAQALGVERTNAGMKSLSETLVHNTQQSVEADELAQRASTQAVDGGDVVGSAVQAMQEINESSSRIADIIAVIDEIAFQTNLLALNAAVEAARAGEHGRGFAVVAGEVRNLAQRSASAAKEIKTLIQTSVQRVEDGSRLVNESGGTLAAIVDSIKRVSGIIGDVATASRAQASSVGQLNEAVHDIEESTQQNAALVEEIAAASKSLEEQADRMVSLVDYFRTERASDMAARRAA